MEISRGTHIFNCISQTLLPEPTETKWCCSRRSTYVLQLCDCRDILNKAFFIQVSNPEHKLNYLLEKRHEHPYELRHNQKFKIEIPHTERYKNNFIMHPLVNYQ